MMKHKLPIFLDGPDKQTVGVSIIFSVLCFFSLPFLLLLFLQGLQNNIKVVSWFEIVFHVIAFSVTLGIFKDFVKDSWDEFVINRKEIFFFVKIGAAIALGIALVYYMAYVFYPCELTYLFGYGTLPIGEMNLFILPSEVALVNPIVGTLCMTLVTPLTTACLYYAVCFPNAHNVRPWLGYLVLAAGIALPRIANAVTYWIPYQQMILYFAQLPVHMVACWTYRRTNSIWAPTLVLAVANLGASLLMIFTYLL